jgi:hypothetical protein
MLPLPIRSGPRLATDGALDRTLRAAGCCSPSALRSSPPALRSIAASRWAASIYWADILPATLLVAIGMGVSVAPLTTTVMASVDPGYVGAASGFNSAVARIAGLIATALLGFVFAQQGSADAFIAGFRVAVLVGAASAAVAAGCAFLLIRPSISPSAR